MATVIVVWHACGGRAREPRARRCSIGLPPLVSVAHPDWERVATPTPTGACHVWNVPNDSDSETNPASPAPGQPPLIELDELEIPAKLAAIVHSNPWMSPTASPRHAANHANERHGRCETPATDRTCRPGQCSRPAAYRLPNWLQLLLFDANGSFTGMKRSASPTPAADVPFR